MFTLLSGPFHPHLESKLVETVKRIKAPDLTSPLAIVVPSESLRRRLQWLLCVEHKCSLFEVYFFTFHQLAWQLDTERRAVGQSETQVPAMGLVGDFFYEYLLSIILQKDTSVSNLFGWRGKSSGLYPALWQTIQDLQVAQVEPSVVLRGLEEGLFNEAATERLQGVLGLHAMLQAWSEQVRVGLPDDLTHSVIPWIPHSPFIAKLSSVLYYGFYDITQVQLSLLEEIARGTTVTVFFPLFRGEASKFAQRFFDRHLLKAGVVHRSLQDNLNSSGVESVENWTPQVQVVSAVGQEGELHFCCKAIVKHMEQVRYAWHEIGVVARNLEPYLSHFPRIFEAYRIPFGTTATRPILEEPLAKVWWMLAGLREEQFGWRNVLDVVTSPWFQGATRNGELVEGYSQIWVHAIHHFRIMGGRDDWDRLARMVQNPAAIQDWQQRRAVDFEYASESLQIFVKIVGGLIQDCEALPTVGPIGELTQAFESLLEKYLYFASDHPSFVQDAASDEQNECLTNGFEEVISALLQLDRLDQQVTWEQWMKLFRSLLEGLRLPIPRQTSMGVQVLDAMAARGRPYRILFVLGVNDHVFPRVVREDAFLRDRDRKVLAESLGYKIDEKMMGFDEEALLFRLLHQSAHDHLYLLYQRADENGRQLAPSSFLQNSLYAVEAECEDSEWAFPVGLLKRSHVSYFSSDHATLQEVRLRSILGGQPLQTTDSHGSPWWTIFQNGKEMLANLEHSGAKAGVFDGLMEDSNLHWQEFVAQGFSPTRLETYAQCPMRYWMTHILTVQGIQDPVSNEVSRRVWGELVHQILFEVYQDLSTHAWPKQTMSSVEYTTIVNSQVDHVFQEYAQRFGEGYRLIWDWMRTRITRMVLLLIEHDQADFIERGWIPCEYEVEALGEFLHEGQVQPEILNLRGRFDRVDAARNGSCVRIVDYKVSLRRSFQTEELDLVTNALQGRQLQPPLYSFMTPRNFQGEKGRGRLSSIPVESVEFRYLRPMQQESVCSATFSSAVWEMAKGVQVRQAIDSWIHGIRVGQFFILPGAYCRNCSYSPACRFQHHPSWYRAHRLPRAKMYRQVRKQKASND